MDLVERVEQILQELRPVFSRQAAFMWFVLVFWGIVLVDREPALTSYLNAIGLGEQYYHHVVQWFQASSWSASGLSQRWSQWLVGHGQAKRLQGRLVYIGDSIKVMKAGSKMPLVKKLKQQSQNINKPSWIRGHHFGLLSLLMGQGEALYAVPLQCQLQEGIRIYPVLSVQSQWVLAIDYTQTLMVLGWLNSFYTPFKRSLVQQMADQSADWVEKGSIVILDAFYGVKPLLKLYRCVGLFLISPVRRTTVAYAQFDYVPGASGRGRPRLWGTKIKLASLFAQADTFATTTVTLYGRPTLVRYQTLQLHWDTPYELVQFVLSQLPCGRQVILITNDLLLSGPEVIQAYGWRFKIEVTFRTLVHLLGGFSYRFWLKALPKNGSWPHDVALNWLSGSQQQALLAKVESFERFVTLHALVLGVFQILALEAPKLIGFLCPQWFRTLPKHAYPSEQVVRVTLRHLINPFYAKLSPSLLLHKFLAHLSTSPSTRKRTPLAA